MAASPQEKQILQAVLQYIETTQGICYTLKTRPEEDPMEPGTYDFLCTSGLNNQPDLAVEITTFMESSDRKAYDKAISEIADDLMKRLEYKLPGTFVLEIVGPLKCFTKPWRKKPVRYCELKHKKSEFVDQLEKAILEFGQELRPGEERIIHQPILCGLTKHSNKGSLIEIWPDYVDPNMPQDFSNYKPYLDRTLKEILKKKNKQLKIPKNMGKLTVLVLSIDMDDPLACLFGTTEKLRLVLRSQPQESWKYIDQIILERKGKVEMLDVNPACSCRLSN